VDEFDGSLALIWADDTNSSGGVPLTTPDEIMSVITADFNPSQRRAVKKLNSSSDVSSACPQNFNGFSDCYAAIIFDEMPDSESDSDFVYLLRADTGLTYINVVRHTSGFEERVLPLQIAVDQVCRLDYIPILAEIVHV
jgi:ATP-binding cassette subfamily A (ABC1) protein 3